jgi:hypothetical protein
MMGKPVAPSEKRKMSFEMLAELKIIRDESFVKVWAEVDPS